MQAVNYKGLRPSNITKPNFRHVFWLLFWPIYGICFYSLERITQLTFTDLYVPFDDLIPFCEYFLIPYLFWYIFIVWILIYSFFYDIQSFNKFHQFLTISCGVTLLIYLFLPNMQSLRPEVFARDNIFVDIIKQLYATDTNTNVCPSLHVVMSFAVLFTAWHSKRYSTAAWRIAFTVITVIISISTVFVKQHSVVDIYAGVALSFAIYPLVFLRRKKQTKSCEKQPATAIK